MQDVHPDWDHEVRTDETVEFDDWVIDKTHVVWIGEINLLYLLAAKAAKAQTIFVASWFDPVERLGAYALADRIVCLSPSLANRLRSNLQLTNIIYVPVELPDTQARSPLTLRPDKPRVLLNLRGPRSRQLGSKLLTSLSRWFHQAPADWTIWVNKSLLCKKSWVHKAFDSTHPASSFRFEHQADWDTQRLLYSSSDLTIIPTMKGNHALDVVMSLAFGSPVVVFNTPPANEYVCKGNGLMAPCMVTYVKGEPTLVPDIQRFEQTVLNLLLNKNQLGKLKRQTGAWSKERKKLFVEGWSTVFR
jgi:glycosyltransferase involved in cell wall biosynthesis